MTQKKITIKTQAGSITAELHSDPNHPGITISWGDYQIAVIEAEDDKNLHIVTWIPGDERPDNDVTVYAPAKEAK